MLEQFSTTVELLYAAAADATLWDRALSAVETLTGSGAVVHVIPKDQTTPLVNLLGRRAQEHFPVGEVQEWTDNLAASCPRLAAGSRWPDAPYVVDYMILTEAEIDRDPVYDWYGRHDLRYFVGSTLDETPRHQLVWSLQRTPRQGHAQSEDIQLFQLLKPHISRALAMADQLGTLREMRRCTVEALEASTHAIVALDEDGRVLFENSSATHLLAKEDGLRLEAGRLQPTLPAERIRLDRAIAESLLSAPGRCWVRVSRAGGAAAYAIFVAPLPAGNELAFVHARVLVIVHDMATRTGAQTDMLVSIFCLSEAEAKLASALSGGHSIESAAALIGIRQATARSELKSVFRKTGVNRQQDLVRLLTSLASVTAVRPG